VTGRRLGTKHTKRTKFTRRVFRGVRGAAAACLTLLGLVLLSGCTHAPPGVAPKRSSRAERALASDLDRIFSAPVMEQGLWGVEVKSLETGRVLYSRNPRTLMMPASNMKILTLAAAAEILGWDYRFTTTLETSAPLEGGALKGDLYVRGSGDPTINRRDKHADAVFDEWTAALKAAGVDRIDGNVIGDASAFDDRRLGQGWSWDYLQYGYAAPVGALEFDEDVAALTIRPGETPGSAAALELPPDTGLGLLHHVLTGAAGSPTAIELERRPDTNWLDVRGTIAVDAPPMIRDIAVSTPTLYFAHALVLALQSRGITVSGIPRELVRPEFELPEQPRRVLVQSQSPPLREIATTMMKVSQNLYAETLLKAAGAARSGGPGTAEAGIAAARDIFAAWHVAPGTYIQVDGSGLSRYDYVTADLIVTLLEHLYQDPRHKDAFVATLPIAGTDGTIASRLKGTPAEGNAAAKTGSISNARALSGYVRTRDGETLAFSILANSFPIPPATVNSITDLAVERLAKHSNR
jgi:D-alanyl-D-alanine carboxypeptidase/D-alanyl-D-alanine-endopeptidase (penicillin-binding protein 4)